MGEENPGVLGGFAIKRRGENKPAADQREACEGRACNQTPDAEESCRTAVRAGSM